MIKFIEIQEEFEDDLDYEMLEEAPQQEGQQVDPMMIKTKGAEFFCRVKQASNAAHMAHLVTSSYATHMALKDFYEDLIPLADTFAESIMGRLGKFEAFPPCSEKSLDGLQIVGNLTKWIEGTRQIFIKIF